MDKVLSDNVLRSSAVDGEVDHNGDNDPGVPVTGLVGTDDGVEEGLGGAESARVE
jgi:hypothetical protein